MDSFVWVLHNFFLTFSEISFLIFCFEAIVPFKVCLHLMLIFKGIRKSKEQLKIVKMKTKHPLLSWMKSFVNSKHFCCLVIIVLPSKKCSFRLNQNKWKLFFLERIENWTFESCNWNHTTKLERERYILMQIIYPPPIQ